MGRFFVWLSGADRTILAECTSMPRSERSRFAGLGALVLIPAVLGLLSMMYAVSTIQHDPLVYVTAGVVWFFIVASIDRYLVSTTFKSSVQTGYGRAVGIVARLVLAVFVGVSVSHPLILLLFHDSISEELANTQQTHVAALNTAAEAKKAVVPPLPASLAETAASQELRQQIQLSQCLGQLQTAEQSGLAMSLPCGYSSPYATCGPRCGVIGQQKAEADGRIATLQTQVQQEEKAQQTDLQAAQVARKAALDAIDNQNKIDVAQLKATFSSDYLARVGALSRIEKREPVVAVVQWFVLSLFIVVDVLPITMKLATPSGEYEEIRDRRLIVGKVRERVTRQATEADVEGQVRIAQIGQDIETMQRAWSKFMETFTEGTEQFETSADALRDIAAKNGGARAEEQVDNMRDTKNHIWDSWRLRLRGDLEPK